MRTIGIRREDKDAWEARVPLVPDDLRELMRACVMSVTVQPSPRRVFTDDDFAAVGAVVDEDLAGCEIVLAVKEIPEDFFEPGKTYVFFSHTIKGQPYNMAMLRRMMELGCQLIDYERITDDRDRRLISFSRYAGLAGAVDTLWALGRRLAWEGLTPNPFADARPDPHLRRRRRGARGRRPCGRRIKAEGVPEELRPFVIGVTGYGRVSQGAQEVIDALAPVTVAADDLEALAGVPGDARRVHKVVFREEDMVAPRRSRWRPPFDLDDYYRQPERYRGRSPASCPRSPSSSTPSTGRSATPGSSRRRRARPVGRGPAGRA